MWIISAAARDAHATFHSGTFYDLSMCSANKSTNDSFEDPPKKNKKCFTRNFPPQLERLLYVSPNSAEHNKPIPALFVQRDKFLCNVVNFPPGIVIYLRAA